MEKEGRKRSANVQRLRDWVSNHNKLNLAMDFLNIGADLMLNNSDPKSSGSGIEEMSDGAESPLPPTASTTVEEDHMNSRDSDKESDSGISNAKNDLESESDNDKEVEMYMHKGGDENHEGDKVENTGLDLSKEKVESQTENRRSVVNDLDNEQTDDAEKTEPRWSPKSCHCKVRKYVAADGGEFESKILCTNCRLNKGKQHRKATSDNDMEFTGEHVGGAVLRRRNRDLALGNHHGDDDNLELPQKTNSASSRRFNRVSRLERLKQWVEDVDLASVWSSQSDPPPVHHEVTTPVSMPKVEADHPENKEGETSTQKSKILDSKENELSGIENLKEKPEVGDNGQDVSEGSRLVTVSSNGDQVKASDPAEELESTKIEGKNDERKNVGACLEGSETVEDTLAEAIDEEEVEDECETTLTFHNADIVDCENQDSMEIIEESEKENENDQEGDIDSHTAQNELYPWLPDHDDVSPSKSLDTSALLTTIVEEAPSSVAANALLSPDEGIHDVSATLSLLDTSLGQTAFSKSDFPRPLSTSSPKSESLHSGSNQSLNDSGVSAPNSACMETMSLCSRSSTPTPRRKSYRERSQSLSDIGYHTGASALLRVPNKNARPISDSHLRKKLQGKKNVRLPEKDQRILELMMSKHEEEAYQNQLQRDAKLSWDEQRRAEKQTTENQRRHSMTKPSNGRLRRSNSAIQHSNRYQADCALQAEQLAKLKEEELALKMDRKQYLEFKQKQWEELHRKQQEAKAQKVMEKKKKELERKRSVERALQLKEQEEEEYREQMKKKLENNLKRANSKKESKEQKELMQRKYAKEAVAKRVQQRKEEIAKSRREDLEDLKASIEYKHAVAEENLQKVEEEKELQLRMSHHEREKKMAKTRRSLMEQEIEMAMWRKELGEHRKEIEEKAAEVAHMTVEQKARRAQEERIAKEKEHRRNLQRLKKDEEAWKEEMKAQIAVKEFKSKLIQQEKDQTIEESRAIAAQSQQLRDDIRRSYNADSFDKKAKQVALQNRTLGVQGATKNMSSLSLG
ncbi:nucleoprotein TPR isoform X2 [Lingula anatina]|uniref:Nucleoprotein TPR isoform X2 n=1 Tax=Lingula anatina TaxID=7574 RepID=A0A1S3IL53_LINAN|nr:nucleoprotein TPR isoform X2 [Lingula anatina]|eukprot:XP_013398818.1 nucleoprotein TPR isoform X2 [Lingula anatina]